MTKLLLFGTILILVGAQFVALASDRFSEFPHVATDTLQSLTRDDSIRLIDEDRIPIPVIFHRSHKYTTEMLFESRSEAEKRVKRNIDSCLGKNPGGITRYYDDSDVDFNIEQKVIPRMMNSKPEVAKLFRNAWFKLGQDPVLSRVIILKMDLFRLAIVWFYGGWWLDSDALCLDDLRETLRSGNMLREIKESKARWELSSFKNKGDCPADDGTEYVNEIGCIWAWEAELKRESHSGDSSPLNWAFGCVQGHGVLLEALKKASENILSWDRNKKPTVQPEFAAPVIVDGKKINVDVLHLTGPALVEQAMESFLFGENSESPGVTLATLRRQVSGEDPNLKDTWDRSLYVPSLNGALLILPYCFFRSRGCSHLLPRFNDTVIFHHEFDTDWRPAFWHNYF